MTYLVMGIITFSALTIHLITKILVLPLKKPVIVAVLHYFSAFVVACFIMFYLFPEYHLVIRPLIGLLFLPSIAVLFGEWYSKRVFMTFSQMFVSNIIGSLVIAILSFSIDPENEYYYILMLGITLILFILYFLLVLRYAKPLVDNLFKSGSIRDWRLYSLSIILTFIVYNIVNIFITDTIIRAFVLLFIIWSFVILVLAIVNTQEKANQKYEADYAKEIIASGQGHYEKMNELFTTLRIMRHDAKYHHSVVLKLLNKGDISEAIEYLSGQEAELTKHELLSFCDNHVINALLVHYAQKCKESHIDYSFKAAIPKKNTISDYDICIVAGNLLENALAASQKIIENRKILFTMKIHNEQLVLHVENNFSESPEIVDTSGRKSSGLGLRSVNLVMNRYGGKLLTSQDGNVFTASVLMNLTDNTRI